jgi:hypothetical protein
MVCYGYEYGDISHKYVANTGDFYNLISVMRVKRLAFLV